MCWYANICCVTTWYDNTQNVGHPPAHHSTTNQYLSGSGWMSCVLLCLYYLRFCLYVWVYLSCFAYTCKSLKILGKHTQTNNTNITGKTHKKGKHITKRHQQKKENSEKNKTKFLDIQPTTRPRINISQVPAGWAAFWLLLFSKVVCILLCLLELLRLYMQKLKKTRQTKRTTKEKQNKTNNLREKQTNKKQLIQPEPERCLFVVE